MLKIVQCHCDLSVLGAFMPIISVAEVLHLHCSLLTQHLRAHSFDAFMFAVIILLLQFRIQAPRVTAVQRPRERSHSHVRARIVRCPGRCFVKVRRNNRANVLVRQIPLVFNDVCGARPDVTAVRGAAKRLIVRVIAEHVRIPGGEICHFTALLLQEVAATAVAPAHRLRHAPIHAVVSHIREHRHRQSRVVAGTDSGSHQLVPRMAFLPVRDLSCRCTIFVLQLHSLKRVTTKMRSCLRLNVIPRHHPTLHPTHNVFRVQHALFFHSLFTEPKSMRKFVCGNANAPRRVSHVIWIKVHGANGGTRITPCDTRGRPNSPAIRA
ncbi:hypothetical protein TCDM_12861 [Trypanosoma cruzi Dm28c]|uniref:Uncharacterized protein n=1 Tax=Trypanosoma cruzi Dm28c TaxID=1416333 RepID=V5AU82_TRYCR|nr:hypothetical protein TCDM_12861 [Trypanosoma cruzi Dm28c]